MTREEKAKREQIALRDRMRKTVCIGCHDNYYNFPQAGDGWNAPVPSDSACWSLSTIKRGQCPAYHR